MIRSSNSLLYGFISLIPYDVRSTKDGSTYLLGRLPALQLRGSFQLLSSR